MVEIVPLEPKDVPFAKSLTDAEGWARSEVAWRRFFRVQPDGFFQAVVQGTPAGIVGMFCYARLAWVHSLIVVPAHRGKGIGRQLVSFCCDEATRRGIRALKLDAAPGTAPFYARSGWRLEFPSRRFIGKGRQTLHRARGLQPDEWAAVIDADRAALGWDRSRLLRELARDQPDAAFAIGAKGTPAGYVFSAQAEGRVEIGPLVVPSFSLDVARQLMGAVLDRWPGARVRCCVPGTHDEAQELMTDLGFEEEPSSTRMAYGDVVTESQAQFVMAGPAEG